MTKYGIFKKLPVAIWFYKGEDLVDEVRFADAALAYEYLVLCGYYCDHRTPTRWHRDKDEDAFVLGVLTDEE